MQNILTQTADDRGAAGWDANYGFGRVNAAQAVAAALATAPVDGVPPTATITAPAAGSAVSGVVNVTASATDDVGVTRIDCYLNGTLVGTSAAAPAAFAWDTTACPNGSHTLLARAYDAAGNLGSSASVIVTVQNVAPDTTAPAVRITSPANGATLSRSAKTTKVYVSASDNVRVTRVDVYADGKFIASSTSSSPVFNWSTSKLTSGQHTLQAFAYDAAGNVGASAISTVRK